MVEAHTHLTSLRAGILSALCLQGSCACCQNHCAFMCASYLLYLESSFLDAIYGLCLVLSFLSLKGPEGGLLYHSLSLCQSLWNFFPLFSSSKAYLRLEYIHDKIVWIVWNSVWIQFQFFTSWLDNCVAFLRLSIYKMEIVIKTVTTVKWSHAHKLAHIKHWVEGITIIFNY